ncbi:MAG: LPS assembly lipoprotein LptE [Leptospiraceae bacterium]|nr:LPS assembly lipoprotein LptE [Leptospiraceae bacterium]
MKWIFSFIFLFLECSLFQSEVGRPPQVGDKIIEERLRLLYVQNFQNDSYAPAFHTMFTRALQTEIDRRGRFLQIRDKSLAQFRLYGKILHYQKIGNLLDAGNQQLSSEISVIVKLDLQEAGGFSIPLEREEVLGRVYFSDQLGYRESEEQAQARLANILAMRISKELENAWYLYVKEKYYLPSKE